MEIKQAGLRRARRGHARPRDPRLQHLVALDHRDGRRDAAARQGRRLPLLLPGLGDAAGRDHRGRGHRRGDGPAPRSTSRRRSRSSRSPATRSPASSSTGSSTRRSARSGAPRRSRASRSRRSTRRSPPPTSRRWARSSSSTCSASTRSSTSPSTCASPTATRFYVHEGMRKLVAEGKLGAKTGGSGFYENGEPQIPGDGEPDGEELAELMTLKALVEACLRAPGGRLHGARHRPRDDGRRRDGPAPRALPAVHGTPTSTGLDVVLEKLEKAAEEHGERFAPPTRPASGSSPRAASGMKTRPGLLRLPAARRGRPDRHGQARDARRRRDRLARQPADERDLPAGDQGPRHRLGAGQGLAARSARW